MSVTGSRRVSLFLPLFFVLSFSFISQSHAKELKIGAVDIEKIYSSYGKAKESRQEIQGKKESRQIELAKKQADLQVLISEYSRNASSMKEADKQEYNKKIRDLRAEIISYTRLSNRELTAENRQFVQARLNEIAAIVQDYARKNGFDLVIDKKSLPFFSDTYNLTDEMIKLLNK